MESKILEIESEIAKVNRDIEETNENIKEIATLAKMPFESWGTHSYGVDEKVARERLMNEESQLIGYISYRSQLMNKKIQLRDEKTKKYMPLCSSVTEAVEQEYENYLQRGHKLKGDSIVQDILKEIKEIENSSSDITPFIFLDGSSGIGKSQMYFNLLAAGCNIHYMLCSEIQENSQKIYKKYSNITQVFLECVKLDLNHVDGGLVDFDSAEKLYIYQFILALIKKKENMTFEPATKSAVLEALKCADVRPVVFLDEFPALSSHNNADDNFDMLRLLKNGFRYFKIVVIVGSTTSTAANLIKTSGQSRNGNDEFHWCTVYPRMPKYYPDSTNGPPDFVHELINNSRPWFGLMAQTYRKEHEIKNCSTLEFLESMLQCIKKIIFRTKNHCDSEYFLFGQVCLNLSTAYIEFFKNEDGMVDNLLIHRHFACLVEDTPFQLIRGVVLHKFNDTKWHLNCRFPNLQDDILLFLVLGGKDSIVDKKIRIPYRDAVDRLLKNQVLKLRFNNSNQPSNSGMEFEACVSSAIIVASHCGGLNGIEFKAFLLDLMYEFNIPTSSFAFPGSIDSLMDTLMRMKIPYLSPPNQKWPSYMSKIDYIHIDNFTRTINADQIDFGIDSGIISGECKDLNAKLSLDVMKSILSKVPIESSFHLVFCNTLQKGYFGRSSLKKWLSKNEMDPRCK